MVRGAGDWRVCFYVDQHGHALLEGEPLDSRGLLLLLQCLEHAKQLQGLEGSVVGWVNIVVFSSGSVVVARPTYVAVRGQFQGQGLGYGVGSQVATAPEDRDHALAGRTGQA